MSEFKRIKNKITKRHYTGILKGEALYLVKTIERLLGEVEPNRLYDLGLDKDCDERGENAKEDEQATHTRFMPSRLI